MGSRSQSPGKPPRGCFHRRRVFLCRWMGWQVRTASAPNRHTVPLATSILEIEFGHDSRRGFASTLDCSLRVFVSPRKSRVLVIGTACSQQFSRGEGAARQSSLAIHSCDKRNQNRSGFLRQSDGCQGSSTCRCASDITLPRGGGDAVFKSLFAHDSHPPVSGGSDAVAAGEGSNG